MAIRFVRLALAAALAVAAGCSDSPRVSMDEARVRLLDESIGRGKPARNGDVVCIDYSVQTTDHEELLWGRDFCFTLGGGAVVAGLDAMIPGMQAGGRRTVWCPPHKHWGREGYGGRIPAGTPLVFEIKLVSVQ